MRLAHTHADHPHAAADLDRRRGHRPALLLPPPRRLRDVGCHRQVHLHRRQPTFTNDYLLKYSVLERVEHVEEIEHRDHPRGLQQHDDGRGIEIVSVADIPAGTGLGSSGSFTVGLLRALHAHKREQSPPTRWPKRRAHIEIERLGEPVGKQDQYIAAFGGLTCFDVPPRRRGRRRAARRHRRDAARPRGASPAVLHRILAEPRSILGDQKERSEGDDEAMLAQPRLRQGPRDARSGRRWRPATPRVRRAHARALDAQTEPLEGISQPRDRRVVRSGLANGALGGKLVGAGAGGFLLFYAEDPLGLRRPRCAEGAARDRGSLRPRRLDRDGPRLMPCSASILAGGLGTACAR